jgi:transcriptional regulator with XRE-family HTH domain
MDEALRQRLLHERRTRGMSARAAAAAGGVSNTTWGRLEAGEIDLTERTRLAVATAFGWQIDWPENPPPVTSPGVNQPGDDDVAERVQLLQREVAALSEVVLLLAMDVEDERRGALDELLDAIREVRSDVEQQPQAG